MPPDPPRPSTPLIARRLWTEPTVRPWWLMAAAVLLAVVGTGVGQLVARVHENRLITAGVAETATLVGQPNRSVKGQAANLEEPATISFDWHGQPTDASGFLTRPAVVGGPVDVHVDPGDPTLWTDQTEPTPLVRALWVALAVLPVAATLAAVAAARRRAVARTYRLGRAAVAVVADRRQSAVAPLSWAVRCSFRDGADRRLRTVYVPRRGGPPTAKGDELWLLLPVGRGRVVAAAWFEAEVGSQESGVGS